MRLQECVCVVVLLVVTVAAAPEKDRGRSIISFIWHCIMFLSLMLTYVFDSLCICVCDNATVFMWLKHYDIHMYNADEFSHYFAYSKCHMIIYMIYITCVLSYLSAWCLYYFVPWCLHGDCDMESVMLFRNVSKCIHTYLTAVIHFGEIIIVISLYIFRDGNVHLLIGHAWLNGDQWQIIMSRDIWHQI